MLLNWKHSKHVEEEKHPINDYVNVPSSPFMDVDELVH
jgi:hypothetical protein